VASTPSARSASDNAWPQPPHEPLDVIGGAGNRQVCRTLVILENPPPSRSLPEISPHLHGWKSSENSPLPCRSWIPLYDGEECMAVYYEEGCR